MVSDRAGEAVPERRTVRVVKRAVEVGVLFDLAPGERIVGGAPFGAGSVVLYIEQEVIHA